tara:strand:+ start:281 stop:721 length:441 start_codon:yes stop_codon:yes gene_type:complete
VDSYRFYQADEKDLDELFELGKKFKRELRDLNLPDISESKVFKILDMLLDKGKIICASKNDNQEIIGSVGFYKSQHWWSDKYLYNIQWLYVVPEYRNFIIFRNLIDGVKKIAKDDPIAFSITTKLKLDAVLKKLGFEEMGKNWRLG